MILMKHEFIILCPAITWIIKFKHFIMHISPCTTFCQLMMTYWSLSARECSWLLPSIWKISWETVTSSSNPGPMVMVWIPSCRTTPTLDLALPRRESALLVAYYTSTSTEWQMRASIYFLTKLHWTRTKLNHVSSTECVTLRMLYANPICNILYNSLDIWRMVMQMLVRISCKSPFIHVHFTQTFGMENISFSAINSNGLIEGQQFRSDSAKFNAPCIDVNLHTLRYEHL